LAFIGAWVEQIGALLQSNASIRIGIITSLILPVEALWRRASYVMQPSLTRQLSITPFSTSSVPSTAMVIYAFFYMSVALVLAMYVFSRRDL
jgi:ABC-type transport system involved in multi-copper enzyme maturation permease subunit